MSSSTSKDEDIKNSAIEVLEQLADDEKVQVLEYIKALKQLARTYGRRSKITLAKGS